MYHPGFAADFPAEGGRATLGAVNSGKGAEAEAWAGRESGATTAAGGATMAVAPSAGSAILLVASNEGPVGAGCRRVVGESRTFTFRRCG